MKQRNNYLRSLLCGALSSVLALGALSSCRDTMDEPQSSQPTSRAEVTDLLDQSRETFNMAFSADVTPVTESGAQQGRELYVLTDRATYRGEAGNAAYRDDLTPMLVADVGTKLPGTLLFMRPPTDGETSPTIVRVAVEFEVTYSSAAGGNFTQGSAPRMHVVWKGNVSFPAKHNLATEWTENTAAPRSENNRQVKDTQWQVMGIIGYATRGGDLTWISFNYLDEQQAERLPEPKRYPGNSSYTNAGVGIKADALNTPYMSQWVTVRTFEGEDPQKRPLYTGYAYGLEFRPQGTILAYDLGIDDALTMDFRSFSIVSNVMDFMGRYDLSDAALWAAWQAKDSQGYGLPEWQTRAVGSGHWDAYDDPDSRYMGRLRTGTRIYPYDLATSSISGNMWGGSQADRLTKSDNPSLFHNWFIPQRILDREGIPQNAWAGERLSGHFPREKADYYQPGNTHMYYMVWGMPRKQMPAKPATYLYADIHPMVSAEDVYVNSFNPGTQIYNVEPRINTGRKLIEDQEALNNTGYDKQLRGAEESKSTEEARVKQLETAPSGETAEAAAERTRRLAIARQLVSYYQAEIERITELKNWGPRSLDSLRTVYPPSLFSQYSTDSTAFYGTYLQQFMDSGSARAQRSLTLHQSNATFRSGRIYHARPTLVSDLIITEVFYEKRNGENYSSVEIYNPRWTPVDLTQYAIARLIPSQNGTHFSFRRYDGTPTDQLSEAQLLPLTAGIYGDAPYNYQSPYASSQFTAPAGADFSQGENRIFRVRSVKSNRAEPLPDGSWIIDYDIREDYKWATIRGASPWYPNPFFAFNQDNLPIGQGLVHYMLSRQTIILGGSGFINKKPFPEPQYRNFQGEFRNQTNNWLRDNWYPSIYDGDVWKKGVLRYFYAYADGTPKAGNNQYNEGTLDYNPGDAFVLVKKMQDGGLQIIDATGPLGLNGEAVGFPGTYSDYQAEMAKYRNLDHFSVQKTEGYDFPFLAPYNTQRRNAGQWSDNWSVKTNYSDYTIGKYTNFVALRIFGSQDAGTLAASISPYPYPHWLRPLWKDYDWRKYAGLKPAR